VRAIEDALLDAVRAELELFEGPSGSCGEGRGLMPGNGRYPRDARTAINSQRPPHAATSEHEGSASFETTSNAPEQARNA
jgi:hypothetical protein